MFPLTGYMPPKLSAPWLHIQKEIICPHSSAKGSDCISEPWPQSSSLTNCSMRWLKFYSVPHAGPSYSQDTQQWTKVPQSWYCLLSSAYEVHWSADWWQSQARIMAFILLAQATAGAPDSSGHHRQQIIPFATCSACACTCVCSVALSLLCPISQLPWKYARGRLR